MYDFNAKFKEIIEKMGKGENTSVELNEIINENEKLIGEYNNHLDEMKKMREKNEELKEANTKLLLTKGFIQKSFDEDKMEPEEPAPLDMKDFVKFER